LNRSAPDKRRAPSEAPRRTATRSHGRRLRALAAIGLLAGALCSSPALPAESRRIESFDHTTWQRLQPELQRPAVVVFTATWCANCPEVLRRLAEVRRAHGLSSPLVVVVIDGDGHPRLLDEPHYRAADRLFVFEGEEAMLRHTVQPQWRGVTPYVALLPRKGAPAFVAGTPSAAQIESWLRP
jgi:thiol-disulfide isomerase/thioredoxin